MERCTGYRWEDLTHCQFIADALGAGIRAGEQSSGWYERLLALAKAHGLRTESYESVNCPRS